jgi:hypothetical protein
VVVVVVMESQQVKREVVVVMESQQVTREVPRVKTVGPRAQIAGPRAQIAGPRAQATDVAGSRAWEEGTVVQAFLNDPQKFDRPEYQVPLLSPYTSCDRH